MFQYVKLCRNYPLIKGERGITMKCKFCSAELEETVTICPECGNDLTQSPEETKNPKKTWKIVLTIIAGICLLGVLAGAVLYGYGVDLGPRENDVYYNDSYTIKDAKLEKKADTVVATMGNQVLTNGQLQSFYWMGVFDFLDYYAYYLDMIGLDIEKPLDEQVCDEATGMTYQQMFLESALESWRRYATLVRMSEESGFVLSSEQQQYLDDFENHMKTLAADNKYDDVEEFIDKELFPGGSLKDYYEYNRLSFIALTYYDTLYETLMPTEAEIEAYYTEHETEFKNNGFAKEDGDYYDVRHILIEVKGTTGEDGKVTYSDADWEACRAEAQQILDDYLAGEKTEDAFAALAKEKSKDPGSAEYGGLYQELTKDTNFVEEFKNWYLDESRKVGDTGLVKSSYGYHVMYFSGSTPIWESETKTMVLSENTSKMLEDAKEKWPMEVNYNKISLGYVDLAAE